MRKAALICALVLGTAAPAAAADAMDWVARVKRMAGVVTLERDGAATPVAVGDRLPADAILVTGPESGAGLTFRDNSRASLGPNGRLALAEFAFEPGKSDGDAEHETRLDQGVAAFVSGRVVKRKEGAMRVRTPAALLGVRGTTFLAVTGQALDQ